MGRIGDTAVTEPPYRTKGILYDDIPPLPPGWLRVADHKEEWEKLRVEARAEAERLAKHLFETWPVRRVWVYGSTVGVWQFTCNSDIDLAAEGLPPEKYFTAWGDLEEASSGKFRIDLRCREDFDDERWNGLIPKPVLLYEHAGGC